MVSPKIVGAAGSYNSQPQYLISIKEFEEHMEASQEILEVYKGMWTRIKENTS